MVEALGEMDMKRLIRIQVEDVEGLSNLELAKSVWEDLFGRCWHEYRRCRIGMGFEYRCTKCGDLRGTEDLRMTYLERRRPLYNLHKAWPIVNQWQKDSLPFLKALEVVKNTRKRTQLMFGLKARDICVAGLAATRYRRDFPLEDE